jgi:dGTPase
MIITDIKLKVPVMSKNCLQEVAVFEKNEKWKQCTSRLEPLPARIKDIRSEFERDITRLLHCTAYRRLKHKTQVFFAPSNDHICTRIEHVNYVASISHTIGKYLGLNTELINAIALGHDLGHAPFGHLGEKIIRKIVKEELNMTFWHEKNSLYFIDKIETLEDHNGRHRNLNLTYGVRDGIICHCGEIDENAIFPRSEIIDLETINKPNEYSPYSWEACVVKISDKIAYLGKDIEDAITLGILSHNELKELSSILREIRGRDLNEINNTTVIHSLSIDLCENSTIKNGIKLSDSNFKAMNTLKKFNYEYIYLSGRLRYYQNYAELIIESIYNLLKEFYDKENCINILKEQALAYPLLISNFIEWLLKFSIIPEEDYEQFNNCRIYDLSIEKDYSKAIIDFIAGMTDLFAKRAFEEIVSF